jgi:glycine C-acetyltransferase
MGSLKRLELLQTQPELREKLWTIVKAIQKGFREAGLDIGCTESPVTPVMMHGGLIEATNLVVDLRQNYGIFCSVVIYPVIPKDHILLRIIPTASHTIEDVERTVAAFKDCAEKLKAGKYQANEFIDVSKL